MLTGLLLSRLGLQALVTLGLEARPAAIIRTKLTVKQVILLEILKYHERMLCSQLRILTFLTPG